MTKYRKIASFKDCAEFQEYLQSKNIALPLDEALLPPERSPMNTALECYGQRIGNRWCILPMEGWDCQPDGAPSELTRRRWLNFARSGAKLLFGCEACAVMASGKSNTRQLLLNRRTLPAISKLRAELELEHARLFGGAEDLMIGLQLTHSGRYSHPHDDRKLESVTAYSHPFLDRKFNNSAANVVSDEQVEEIIAHFIQAAGLAQEAGFSFVDIKMAHGYLGHEFLSARSRPGKYGGSLANRCRFFSEIVQGIKRQSPGLHIAVRLSIFDCIPYEKGPDGVGLPMRVGSFAPGNYPFAFGGDGGGLGYDLRETLQFLELAQSLGVELVCSSACSPYYNPHFQRPAYFPVSDGYLPPEEPLLGAARQIAALAEVKRHFRRSSLRFVGSAYSCLQEFLPQVAQSVLRQEKADLVGIGRMVLAYPRFCADLLQGRELNRARICRTFGDCTTAPRAGMVSGCYPLDQHYKQMPEYEKLKALKKQTPGFDRPGQA